MMEVHRVLADDGLLFLNLGDAYLCGSQVGLPWRIACSMRDGIWILRRDIVWEKPNPTPESASNRPTCAHEYVFMFSKRRDYYYDADAIRQPYAPSSLGRYDYPMQGIIAGDHQPGENERTTTRGTPNPLGANVRDVWTIPTQPSNLGHHATMPHELARRCILAASRPEGKHCDCARPVATPVPDGIDREAIDPSVLVGGKGLRRPRNPTPPRVMTRQQQRFYAEQIREVYRSKPEVFVELEREAGGRAAIDHYMRTDFPHGARVIPPKLLERWIANDWLTRVEHDPCLCSPSPPDLVLDSVRRQRHDGSRGPVARSQFRRGRPERRVRRDRAAPVRRRRAHVHQGGNP